MTKAILITRILRVKGLKIKDPWGIPALVDRLDGDTVWLWYDGIEVPFQRGLDECVWAENGNPLVDKASQFDKTMVDETGTVITLHYEPNWSQSERIEPRPTERRLEDFKKVTKWR